VNSGDQLIARLGALADIFDLFLRPLTGRTPRTQATVTAWASTSVANLEHEPAGPLALPAFIGPDSLLLCRR
jgi:hypothetical protein